MGRGVERADPHRLTPWVEGAAGDPMDRERLAEELRRREIERSAEFQRRRASIARTRADLAAARAAGKRRHHSEREARMGRMRVKAVGQKRRPGCCVAGCANEPDEGTIICRVHAQALRPSAAPAKGSRKGSPGDGVMPRGSSSSGGGR